VIYGFFAPTNDRIAAQDGLNALLDLTFEERGVAKENAEKLRSQYFAHLFLDVSQAEIAALLEKRRYLIIQGPPGTGKTRMAQELLATTYHNQGTSIQFHPNTTYEFYEAWVETIASKLSLRLGGILKIGRKHETVTPISWERPYQGSQKSLIPDIVIHRESETIVIDAKYKRHWEDIQIAGWHSVAEEIQQSHRGDLMQVLAYSSLFSTPSVIACIAYPCRRQTWESLKRRDLRYHKASLHSGARRVNLILTVLPMIADPEEAVETLRSAIAAQAWRCSRHCFA
jgi:hypothetical protein